MVALEDMIVVVVTCWMFCGFSIATYTVHVVQLLEHSTGLQQLSFRRLENKFNQLTNLFSRFTCIAPTCGDLGTRQAAKQFPLQQKVLCRRACLHAQNMDVPFVRR